MISACIYVADDEAVPICGKNFVNVPEKVGQAG